MRVVELFGPAIVLGLLAQLCGVDRSAITRWVDGTVQVPHAVVRLLELMREIR